MVTASRKYSLRHSWFAVCAALLLCPGLASGADDWTYTVRPGDSLWRIANLYCGKNSRAAEIAQHNGITDLTQLRAGMRIAIPQKWLVFEPSHAVFVSLFGEVELLDSNHSSANSQRPQPNDRIDMGQVVVTGAGSALIRFADNSQITIQPRSRVLFNKLTLFGPAGMVDTHLRFSYGRGTTRVIPNQQHGFRIETPEGIAAVRGTEFRVGSDPTDGVVTTETLTGEVVFEPNNLSNISLPAGYGVAASTAGVVKESLLPAPQLSLPAEVGRGENLTWPAIAGAKAYNVDWSLLSNPQVTVKSTRLQDPISPVDIQAGEYLLKVRGVSPSAIEGQDASSQLRVLAQAPILQPHPQATSGSMGLRWQDADAQGPYTLELTDLDSQAKTTYEYASPNARISPPVGRYSWRVRGATSSWSQPGNFQVDPATPKNLTSSSRRKQLSLAWDAVDSADEYLVTIIAADGSEQQTITPNTQLNIELPRYGRYQVTVTARQRDLTSGAAELDTLAARRPWWLIGLAIIAIAL